MCLVTTESDFAREEGTRLITDKNDALDRVRGGVGGKYTVAKGYIGSPMSEVVVVLKVKVEDDTVVAEILWKWR